ncbi:MAG: helix-turn-helix domain-containing protein [Lactobacillales bacterium]|jgi:hypothetical protein|nr:helix-turn-helix domain-containing protein [Lactobacillales bacterium]
MRKMLSSTERRRLEIIERLTQEKNWVGLEELATEVGCSSKTLGTDFQFFDMVWKDYFTIEFSKKKGVRIHQNRESKMESIYAETLQQSSTFNFFEQLFFMPYQSVDYWKNKLYISESSLYRLVSQINVEMEKCGIHVERQPFIVNGKDERWLRIHYTNYFEQAYGANGWPFEQLDRKVIVGLVQKIGENIHLDLTDEQIVRSSLCVGVCLTRMQQGFILEESITHGVPDDYYELAIKEVTEQTQAAVAFKLPPYWYKGISRTVYHHLYGWDNAEEKKRIEGYIDEIITNISEASGIKINNKDRTKLVFRITGLYTQYKMFPYIRFSLFNNYHYQAQRMYENYPFFSKFMEDSLERLEKKTKFPWKTKLRDHVTCILFADWSNLPILLETLRDKVQILVISSVGETHAKMLGSILGMYYHYHIETEIFHRSMLTISEADKKAFNQYDMVVSNSTWKELPKEKLFVVDNIPSVKQISEIGAEIGRLQLMVHKGEK